MHLGSLIATVLLILITGCFVAAEFAAVRVRATQLEASLASDPRAALALEVHRHLSRHLSSIQVAITLLTISLGAVGEDVFVRGFQHLFGGTPWPRTGLFLGSFAGILVITLLQVVLAELLPRGVALRAAQTWALRTAGPLLFWSRAIGPVTQLLTSGTHALERLLGVPAAVDHAPTEDELRRMLMKSKLEISRKDLIENLFDFSKRTVKEIAGACTEGNTIEPGADATQALEKMSRKSASRLMVVDHEKLVGILALRDLLQFLAIKLDFEPSET